MRFTLEALEILTAGGGPKSVTAQAVPDPETRRVSLQVSVNGSPAVRIATALTSPEQAMEQLKACLRFHPDDVSVNGTPTERENFSDMGTAVVTRCRGRIDNPPEEPGFIRIPGTLTGAERRLGLGTLAGGVVCQTLDAGMRTQVYHARRASGKTHWDHADRVEIRPVTVVNREEIPHIRWERGYAGEEVSETIRERNRQQTERTIRSPLTPEPARENLYRFVTSFNYTHNRLNGAPVLVNGTPVTVDEDMPEPPARQGNRDGDGYYPIPALTSLAEALYAADAGTVPVASMDGSSLTGLPKIAEARFEVEESGGESVGWLTPVRRITVSYRVEGEKQERAVEAACFLAGEYWDNPDCYFVPGKVSPEELAEMILRCHFDSDGMNRDDVDYRLHEFRTEVLNLAKGAVAGDSAVAYRGLLAAHLDNFHPPVKMPGTPVTATGLDGRITATTNPPPEP